MEKPLRILCDAIRAFAETTTDPRLLLETVAERVGVALGAYCGFALVADDGNRVDTVALYDSDPGVLASLSEITPRASITLDGPTPFSQALAQNRVLQLAITPELLRARFPRPEDAARILEHHPRSLLCVPLAVRGEVIGGFNLVRHGPAAGEFDESNVALAKALADHAALAIANARSLAASQRMSERLKLLSELAQQFAAEVNDPRRLLAVVTRRMSEVVGDGCVIRMIDEGLERFEPQPMISHADPAIEAAFAAFLQEHLQRLDQGIGGRVATTGKPVLLPVVDVEQLEAANGRAYRETMERIGVTSILVVPLRASNHTIGVCALCRTSPGAPYTADDLHLVEDVAMHAALAIVNSRLLATTRRALEERLHLSEASRLKSEFLANMSHELRTPLNAVIGFAGLMHAGKAGPMSEVHREYIGDILSSARHLLQLINDVLDLSKVEAGRLELRPEPTDLAKVAAEVQAIVRGLAADKGIRLAIELGPDLLEICVDPRLLKQILYNYLSNAIKFTPDGVA